MKRFNKIKKCSEWKELIRYLKCSEWRDLIRHLKHSSRYNAFNQTLLIFFFLIKTCGAHQKRLIEALLMSAHNICFFLWKFQKHGYSNIQKRSPPKTEKIQIKINPEIFHISAQNIDCGYSLEPYRRGGSNVYPQSLWAKIRKNNENSCKPQFIKMGFKVVKMI